MSQKFTLAHTHLQSNLNCPSCGHPIDVEEALERQADAKLRREYDQKFQHLKRDLTEQSEALARERLEVKQLSAQTWEIIQAELKNERLKLAEKMREEARQGVHSEIEDLKVALQQHQLENANLKHMEVELLQRAEQLNIEKEQMQLTLERQLLQRTRVLEEEIRARFTTQEQLIKTTYEKRLDDQKKLLDEMHRKMEQGSVQLQGEVQEILIEEFLTQAFPGDQIESIKTGVRGADCMQHVFSDQRIQCGSIYYESKRTKSFQRGWIEKLNQDLRRNKADLGVLITQQMPKEIDQIGLIDGIWVCSFEAFRTFVPIIRYHMLHMGESRRYQDQSGEKMQVLYDFLTSHEFRQQVEGIVEGFSNLHAELQKEKRAMQNIWKRREKQIEKVLLNTNNMYGTIKGIAGKEIDPIGQLEFSMDLLE